MIRVTSLRLPLDHDEEALRAAIAARLGIEVSAITGCTLFKRSYDARRRNAIKFVYSVDVETALEAEVLARLAGDDTVRPAPDMSYRPPAIAVAAGTQDHGRWSSAPGRAACWRVWFWRSRGSRPLLLERGKKARERTVDTFGFWRGRGLDPESNVQFGEGGAGTFSDGKLYSQIRDPRHSAARS